MQGSIRVGSIIQRYKEPDESILETLYLISRIDGNQALLINLSGGNRWSNQGIQIHDINGAREAFIYAADIKSKFPSFGDFKLVDKDSLIITDKVQTVKEIIVETAPANFDLYDFSLATKAALLRVSSIPNTTLYEMGEGISKDLYCYLGKKNIIKKCSDCGVKVKCCKL